MINDIFLPVDLSKCEELTINGRFIYFLLSDDVVVYVGQTESLAGRVGAHLLDGMKDFNGVRFEMVGDDVLLTDAEFIQILRHNPKYNLSLPTPSFFITKAKIIRMIESDKCFECTDTLNKYSLEEPQYQIGIDSKVFNYWIDDEFLDFMEDIDRILSSSECAIKKLNAKSIVMRE